MYGNCDVDAVDTFQVTAGKSTEIILGDGDVTSMVEEFYVECYIEDTDGINSYGNYYYALFY